jgi:voltage-gated potassium channel
MLWEGYRFSEAFYMTIITVGTVGFMEIHPLSEPGRWFTSFLILFSLATFAFSLTAITSSIVEGQFKQFITGYKVNSEIARLKNHVILCGFGRNGSQAAENLLESETPFVVIEQNEALCKELLESNRMLVIHGDATDDQVLCKANILQAKALITTLDQDTSNLFVVLSARNLNANLNIISRASVAANDPKLRIAGANHVIMPDKIGGAHMAALVSRPELLEFIDFLSAQTASNHCRLEEFNAVKLRPELQHKTLAELQIHSITGANIIGIRTANGLLQINPGPETHLHDAAQLFALGSAEQFHHLKTRFLA